jgi:cytochrome o ubiquinol oxidase operon protein cyoD
MSAHAEQAASGYAPEHHHQSHHDHAQVSASARHGSFKDYLIGFALAAALTAIPFWIVMDNVFREPTTAAVVILIFAFVQIVVHMVYFLHMNTKSEGGWTVLALIFTAVLVLITLTGSLWVMTHLDANMMPMPSEAAMNTIEPVSPAQTRHMP